MDKLKELDEKILSKWKVGSTPEENGVYLVGCFLGDGDFAVALGNFHEGKWLNFFFDFTVLLADLIDYNAYEVDVLGYAKVADSKDVYNWLESKGAFDDWGNG